MTDDAPAAVAKKRDRNSFTRCVTINRPRAELYAFWRDFSRLSYFMENVVHVELLDEGRSRWTVKAPAGKTVAWTAKIVDEERDHHLAWASEDGADVPNSGSVRFEDAGNRGTIVSAIIHYDPPGGAIGQIIAKMFQRDPTIQALRELRRFKQLMETGEIATAARTAAQRDEEED